MVGWVKYNGTHRILMDVKMMNCAVLRPTDGWAKAGNLYSCEGVAVIHCEARSAEAIQWSGERKGLKDVRDDKIG